MFINILKWIKIRWSCLCTIWFYSLRVPFGRSTLSYPNSFNNVQYEMIISLAGNKRDKNKYWIYGSSRKVSQNTEASYFEGGYLPEGLIFPPRFTLQICYTKCIYILQVFLVSFNSNICWGGCTGNMASLWRILRGSFFT